MRQEFLAAMLWVQRPSVSIAANALQRAGLIAYRRGELSIQNPAALRLAACECYTITEAQFDKMFGSDWRTHDSRSDLRIAH
jgi:Mn-dependent DtxR family transcriptional regulator